MIVVISEHNIIFNKYIKFFLISNFRRILNLLCILLVFPRRLIVVCRRFGTLYRFHLQGLDVKYEKRAEDVVFIYQG